MNLKKFGGIEGGCTLCVDKLGHENVLVVAKATFDIGADGQCRLSPRQQPVAMADEHHGDPATTSIRYASDFALDKPLADVIVNGSAYAPAGRPATRVQVGIRVGALQKVFTVVGNRVWRAGPVVRASSPEPFETMPISYDNAFGGVDNFHPDPAHHRTFAANPVGKGYHRLLDPHLVDGTPLPNTEETDAPISTPNGSYRPMSLGCLGRNFFPRYKLAGTYDQNWIDDVFPFLPADFDDRYHQAAPEDQRCPYLRGGEPVTLANLSREGVLKFAVPSLPVSMYLVFRSGHQRLEPKLDTLIIEPSLGRCMLVWRASTRLATKLTDIYEVWVGTPSRGRLLAMLHEKRYIERGKASA